MRKYWFAAVMVILSVLGPFPPEDGQAAEFRRAKCLLFETCLPASLQSRLEMPQATSSSKAWDREACRKNANDMLPWDRISPCEQVLKSGLGTKIQRANAFVALGYAYQTYPTLSGGDFKLIHEKALKAFSAGAAEDPGNTEAVFARIVLQSDHSPQLQSEAIKKFDQMIARSPHNWLGYYGKIRTQIARMELGLALKTASEMQKALGNHPMALFMQAKILRLNGQLHDAFFYYAEATKAFERERPVLPGNLVEQSPWVGWAEVADQLGRFVEAAEIMEAYIGLQPAGQVEQMDYISFARVLNHAGKHKDAVSALKKAKSLEGIVDPTKIDAEIALTELSSGGDGKDVVPMLNNGAALTKRQVLKVQLMLRKNGFNQVDITGSLDALTVSALHDCARLQVCQAVLGVDL